jgi:hypothetical protein
MGISKSTQFDRFDRTSFISPGNKNNKHQLSSSLNDDHHPTTNHLREKHIPEYPPLIICKDSQCQTTQSSFTNPSKSSHSIHFFTLNNLLTALLTYLFFCLLICSSKSLQTHFIYLNYFNFPLTSLSSLPSYGLTTARNIHFQTHDGFTIHGWHLLPPGNFSANSAKILSPAKKELYFNQQLSMAKLVIIQLHGNAGNRGVPRRIELMKQLASEFSAHVIAIDYRGFGDSEGSPSESGTARDLFALWKWLEMILLPQGGSGSEGGGAPPRIVIYSMSLGTGIAVNFLHHLSLQQQTLLPLPGSLSSTESTDELFVPLTDYTPPLSLYPAGLILVSPFSSIADAIHDYPYAMVFRVIPFLFRFL